jgi:hypothetical protein
LGLDADAGGGGARARARARARGLGLGKVEGALEGEGAGGAAEPRELRAGPALGRPAGGAERGERVPNRRVQAGGFAEAAEVDAEDVEAAGGAGRLHGQVHLEAPRAQQRRVNQVAPIRQPNHQQVVLRPAPAPLTPRAAAARGVGGAIRSAIRGGGSPAR